MFKSILLRTLKEVDTKMEEDKNVLMSQCISTKLDNTMMFYQKALLQTCRYIMSRNPVTVTKHFNKLADEQGDEK